MIALIKELSWYVIVGIAVCSFIGGFALIKFVACLQLRRIVKHLVSVGIFTDRADNILTILYHDKDNLKIGLPDYKVQNSEQDKQVYGDLRSNNIVQLDKRRTGDFWVATKTGNAVILYLERHPQVLHKEGSPHK